MVFTKQGFDRKRRSPKEDQRRMLAAAEKALAKGTYMLRFATFGMEINKPLNCLPKEDRSFRLSWKIKK